MIHGGSILWMDHVIAFLIFHQMYTYVLMMKKKMNNDGNFLSVGNTLLSQDYRGLLLKVVGLFFVPIYQMSHVKLETIFRLLFIQPISL